VAVAEAVVESVVVAAAADVVAAIVVVFAVVGHSILLVLEMDLRFLDHYCKYYN